MISQKMPFCSNGTLQLFEKVAIPHHRVCLTLWLLLHEKVLVSPPALKPKGQGSGLEDPSSGPAVGHGRWLSGLQGALSRSARDNEKVSDLTASLGGSLEPAGIR